MGFWLDIGNLVSYHVFKIGSCRTSNGKTHAEADCFAPQVLDFRPTHCRTASSPVRQRALEEFSIHSQVSCNRFSINSTLFGFVAEPIFNSMMFTENPESLSNVDLDQSNCQTTQRTG